MPGVPASGIIASRCVRAITTNSTFTIDCSRFAFEKFPESPSLLGVQMKSVGEAMASGRTFRESLQKGIRSLEIGRYGLEAKEVSEEDLTRRLREPRPGRLWSLAEALRRGRSVDAVAAESSVDPWFLFQIQQLVEEERIFQETGDLRRAKREGFSDRHLASLISSTAIKTTSRRETSEMAIVPLREWRTPIFTSSA